MPAPIHLNAAAFISPQNHPILVRNFTANSQDDLKYHYVAHTSLDVIDERTLNTNAKHTECYLGLLYSMEDLAVYGYVTPTKVKIVVALALSDAVVRDVDVVLIFKALHSAYRHSLANPFLKLFVPSDADPASMLTTERRFTAFTKRVDDVGGAINGIEESHS